MQRTSCDYNESERPLTSSWLESISWEQTVNKWCRKEESNLRPTDYESVALPTELFRQKRNAGLRLDYMRRVGS